MKRRIAWMAIPLAVLVWALAGAVVPTPARAADDAADVQPLQQMLRQRIQAMEAVQQHLQDPAQRQRIEQMLGEAHADLDDLSAVGAGHDGLQNALQRLERNAERQRQRLTELMDKVPAEAQPGLQRAIAACQTLRTTAMERLRVLSQAGRPGQPRRDVMRPSEMRPAGAGRPDVMRGAGHGPGGMR